MDKVTVICGAVLEKDRKILMVQEKKPYCYGKWNLPTGKLELNKSILQNTVKEVKEETGYDVKLIDLIGVYNYISSRSQNLTRFQFRCKIIGGEESFPKEELLAIKWFTKEEIDTMPDENLRSAYVIRAILENYFDGKSYPLGIIKDLVKK